MLCSACVLVMLGSSLKRSTRVGPSEYTVTYTCALHKQSEQSHVGEKKKHAVQLESF